MDPMGKEDLWLIYILRNGTKPSVLPEIFQPGHRPSSHEIQCRCVYHGFSSEIPKGQWVNNLGFHPLFSWKLYFFEAFHDGLFCSLHNLFKLSEEFMKLHGTASDKCLFVRPCVFWASKMVTLPWLLNHFQLANCFRNFRAYIVEPLKTPGGPLLSMNTGCFNRDPHDGLL